MIVVKIITVIISGHASMFIIAWVMLGVCVGLSLLVSWQESKR